MAEPITISKTRGIRDCGLDEYWLQDQLASDPSILGLGELQVEKREKTQSSGGRLDLLLASPRSNSMYEVEVMLGDTDETHIIRTIEYWDLERRRRPNRKHTAVLVAETFNRRFFNVIQLLSLTIPIIAIQANLAEAEGKRYLHLTKILDEYLEPAVELEQSPEQSDEVYWGKKSPKTHEALQVLRKLLSPTVPKLTVYYQKRSINLLSRGYYLFRLRPEDSRLLIEFWLSKNGKNAEIAPKILEEAGLPSSQTQDNEDIRFSLKVDDAFIQTNLPLFARLAALSVADQQSP